MSNTVARTTDQNTIGIDISKDHLDVHLHPVGIVKRLSNDRKRIARLITWITLSQPTRIIFEATEAYHRALEMALGKAGLPAVKLTHCKPPFLHYQKSRAFRNEVLMLSAARNDNAR